MVGRLKSRFVAGEIRIRVFPFLLSHLIVQVFDFPAIISNQKSGNKKEIRIQSYEKYLLVLRS